MFIPKIRTLLSMLAAFMLYMGWGSAAPALQLPRLGSKISVESKLLPCPVDPPLTRRICNNKVFNEDRLYKIYLYI